MRARLAALALVLILLAALAGGWRWAGDALALASAHAVEWRAGGIAVLVGFALGQMLVAAFGFLPASMTGLGIGFILGPALGFAAAALGTMAGASLAFVLGRSTLRPWAERVLIKRGFDGRRLRAQGWRFVFMLRLSPILPFAPASYALAIMGVNWRDFMLGTLAALPSLAAYVWVGAMATSLGADWRTLTHPALTGLFWLGIAATALLAVQWGGRLIALRQNDHPSIAL